MLPLPAHIYPTIATDRSITPVDFRVCVRAFVYLDFVEYRPLKLEVLAHEIGVSKTVVCRSLAHLVDRGYLERGSRDGARGAISYRLPLARVYPRPADRRAA